MELYNNLLDDQQMLRIFTTNTSDNQHHWHNESELIFVLSGQVTVYLNNEKIILNEEDLLLINHNELHNTILDKEQNSQILTLQFSKNSLKNAGIDLTELKFDLNSTKYN